MMRQRFQLGLLLGFTLVFLCGCTAIKELLLPQSSQLSGFPIVAQEPEYRTAQVSSNGQWIQVSKGKKDSISFHDPLLTQLLLQQLDAPQVPPEMHTGCPLTNTVSLFDAEDNLLGQFLLAGDGDRTAALAEDANRFELTPYAYGLLENQLWRQGKTLWTEPMTWNPDNGTAALELYLGHMLNTLNVQAYGAMDGYFTTYTLYPPQADEKKAQLYLIRSYACYVLEEDAFVKKASAVQPVRITLESLGHDQWAITDFKQCSRDLLKTDPRSAVQGVFPFEMVEQVVYDWKQTDASTELYQMALDYLRSQGMGRIPIVE